MSVVVILGVPGTSEDPFCFFVLLQIAISRIKVVEPFGENGSVGDIFNEVTSTSGRQLLVVEQPQAVMCVK